MEMKNFHRHSAGQPMDNGQQDCGEALERLKIDVLRVIGGEKLSPRGVSRPVFSKNDHIDDVPTEELIYLAEPFISAVSITDTDPQKALEMIGEFLQELSLLQAVPPDCTRTWRSAKAGICARDTRLLLVQTLRSFSTSYPEWDDRDWLLRLLEHMFCRAISLHLHHAREKAVQHTRNALHDGADAPGTTTHCYKILADGRPVPISLHGATPAPVIPPGLVGRSELLKRHGGPSMSLEEYADMALAAMRKREASKNAMDDGRSHSDDEPSETRDELTQKDEASDQRRSNLGNTKRMG